MTQRFPAFTISALSVALVFYFASIPLWSFYIYQRAGGDSAKLFFADFAIVIWAFLSGLVGSVFGLVFAVVAHSRQERFPQLRALAFIGNLIVLSYGLFVVFTSSRF